MTNGGKVWLRRTTEVLLFCILWIPIVLSAVHNIFEHFGKGAAEPWNNVGSKLSGWGLWLAGAFIWYVLISWAGSFILKKFELMSEEPRNPS
jgi:hypothetical protein